MPLFVPDKTKYKNLTFRPLIQPSGGANTAGIVKDENLFLFDSNFGFTRSKKNLDSIYGKVTTSTSGVFTALSCVIFNNAIYVCAIRSSSGQSNIFYSPDLGVTWSESAVGDATRTRGISTDGNFIYLFLSNNLIYRTSDGVNWSFFGSTTASFVANSKNITYIPSKKVFTIPTLKAGNIGSLFFISNGVVTFKDYPANDPYPYMVSEFNGKIFAVMGTRATGFETMFLAELDENYNVSKKYDGDLDIAKTYYPLNFCYENGYIYIVTRGDYVFMLDGESTKLIGESDRNPNVLSSYVSSVALGFNGKTYLGNAPGVMSTL